MGRNSICIDSLKIQMVFYIGNKETHGSILKQTTVLKYKLQMLSFNENFGENNIRQNYEVYSANGTQTFGAIYLLYNKYVVDNSLTFAKKQGPFHGDLGNGKLKAKQTFSVDLKSSDLFT